jgi:hypothetical protein
MTRGMDTVEACESVPVGYREHGLYPFRIGVRMFKKEGEDKNEKMLLVFCSAVVVAGGLR